jgi:hypothetical protein
VVVPDPHMDTDAYPPGVQILRSLTEVEPSLWGLPLFDGMQGGVR